jgi:hypothetical protein
LKKDFFFSAEPISQEPPNIRNNDASKEKTAVKTPAFTGVKL